MGDNARMALATLDAASAEFGGDPARTYATGMSMGGYGTWELALQQPQRFAALVPVCGGLTAPRAERDLFVGPLRDEGLIELRRGRGAIVIASDLGMSKLTTLADDLVAQAKRLGVSRDELARIILEGEADE